MIAELTIQTGLRGEITFLQNSFCSQPFKIANITEDKNSHLLKLMIMSSSPGILDNDKYRIKINAAAKTSLQLQTQSYQRLYNMKNSASQKMEIHISPGASFYFIPHPVVPHTSSSFSATNDIYLSHNAALLWGEVITCGRKESGESFLFTRFHSLTRIFLNDTLLIKENVLIQPLLINVNAIGQLEGYSHQATLIFLDEKREIKKLVKEITEFLSGKEGIEFGITTAPTNGIILRLLGFKAEQLFELLQNIADQFIINNCREKVC